MGASDPSELRAQAQRHLEARAYQAALDAAEASLAAEPDSGSGHSVRAMALSRLGRAEEALAAFREAVRLEPRAARHHLNLAMQLRSLGRIEEALTAALDAQVLQPDLSAARDLISQLQPFPEPSIELPPPPPSPPPQPNTSGTGAEAIVPDEARRWNWGAFFLTSIWAFKHRLPLFGWTAVTSHIGPAIVLGVVIYNSAMGLANIIAKNQSPSDAFVHQIVAQYTTAWHAAETLFLLGFLLSIYCGVAGGAAAWKARRFEDVQEFVKVQRRWETWALGLVLLTIVAGAVGSCVAIGWLARMARLD